MYSNRVCGMREKAQPQVCIGIVIVVVVVWLPSSFAAVVVVATADAPPMLQFQWPRPGERGLNLDAGAR